MRYGSVCSGIEAATHGMAPAWVGRPRSSQTSRSSRWLYCSTTTPMSRAMETSQLSRMMSMEQSTFLSEEHPANHSASQACRGGMDDDRGNLALEFLRLAQRKTPKWLVWENVPGVLSSNGGRDFGSFLGALAEIGYGFAYRVLDAQYFGVAQRRRRVFVVGYLGDWRRAAAVLFERESLLGNPAPGAERRKSDVAPTVVGTGPPFSRTGQFRHDNHSADEGHCLVTGDDRVRCA